MKKKPPQNEFGDWLRAGDVVIDIGANDGAFAGRFADIVGQDGLVVAVEPDHETAGRCRKHCSGKPVEVKEVAVSDACGTRAWYYGAVSAQSSLFKANVPTVARESTVPTTTLDCLMEGLGRPVRAIKVDAQGAELAIARGAATALASDGLRWMLEIWPLGLQAAGGSIEELVRVFSESGWSIVAEGKSPQPTTMTWNDLVSMTSGWHGHKHTNVILARTRAHDA